MLTIYKASAGSGKTHQLTGEYLNLLFASPNPKAHQHILAVTFTNKATEEMKTRIIEQLYQLFVNPESSDYWENLSKKYHLNAQQIKDKAKVLLTTLLHDYSAFSVSTIDSFFQPIIRAFARDIGVYGGYEVELDEDFILEQAVDDLFLSLSDKEKKQTLNWLLDFASDKIEDAKKWDVRGDIINLGKEIFKESYQEKSQTIQAFTQDKNQLQDYQREMRAIIKKFEKDTTEIAEKALDIIAKNDLKTTDFSGGSRSALNKLHKIKEGDYDFTATFRKMANGESELYAKKTDDVTRSAIIQASNDGLNHRMVELIAYVDSHYKQFVTADVIYKNLSTLGILSDITHQMQGLLEDEQKLLIAHTNLLIHKIIDNSDAPFIYEKIGLRLNHFMLDEFQDTSILQWKNFMPLLLNSLSDGSMQHGKFTTNANLLVGDVKQSIYRWRNADWELLQSAAANDLIANNAGLKDIIQEKNLANNYRSDQKIVEFNNALFEHMSAGLQDLLNEKIEKQSGLSTGNNEDLQALQDVLEPYNSKIIDAYADTHQQKRTNKADGFVSIRFVPGPEKGEDEEGWKEKHLSYLSKLLEDYQDRGNSPSDLALLVRKNDEAAMIVQYLLAHKTSEHAKPGYSYDVMSSEGLLLKTASSVKFLLSLLRVLVNPNDIVERMTMQFEYAKAVLKDDVSAAALKSSVMPEEDNAGEVHIISSLFSEEENCALNSYKHYTLFEMIENIIALFDMQHWNVQEVPFLQSFQDTVYRFSTGKTSDLNAFLQWWEKRGETQSIDAPENKNAFRVMTIHKAKGLAFNSVVLPFCSWSLDSRMRNIMWCETDETPFNTLPYIPVAYNGNLANTVFAKDYYTELMHTYMDNLNTLYVAFTRPKHELVVLCPEPKLTKDGKLTVNSIDRLMFQQMILHNHTDFNDEDGEWLYEVGTPLVQQQAERAASTMDKNLYPIASNQGRIKLKHALNNFNRDAMDISESPIDYGNLMHEVFSKMQSEEDYPLIIEEYIRNGRINQSEAQLIAKDVAAFWAMPETQVWFKDGVQVLNETTILTPDGQNFRPDRIIIEGNTVTVVDYKFGAHELASHQRQVARYAQLLRAMHYEVKAYLAYVKLGKVIQVVK